jgi:hypothetical protein
MNHRLELAELGSLVIAIQAAVDPDLILHRKNHLLLMKAMPPVAADQSLMMMTRKNLHLHLHCNLIGNE